MEGRFKENHASIGLISKQVILKDIKIRDPR